MALTHMVGVRSTPPDDNYMRKRAAAAGPFRRSMCYYIRRKNRCQGGFCNFGGCHKFPGKAPGNLAGLSFHERQSIIQAVEIGVGADVREAVQDNDILEVLGFTKFLHTDGEAAQVDHIDLIVVFQEKRRQGV